MSKKIVIVSGGELEESFVLSELETLDSQFIIGVDKGMEFNPVKDASDTEIAIRLAMTLGASEIYILGATGGRIDHLWANVQTLTIPFKAGVDTVILDSQNKIRLIGGDTVIRREDAYGPYFSIFPLGQEIYSLSIEGAKYPLHDHKLTPYDSLCVSNQFEEDEVKITFGSGIVILMETRDKK